MSYETELLLRLAALEIEAMAAISVSADAKPYALYAQEAFPYFTNRIADNPVSSGGEEDIDVNTPLVIVRLVISHATAGARGQPENRLYEWGPHIKTYLQSRMWLQTATGTYATRMSGLSITRVTTSGGLRIFEDSGIGVNQVGREFQLSLSFSEIVVQAYY